MLSNVENEAIEEIKQYVFNRNGIEISNETAGEILKKHVNQLALHMINGTSKIKNPKGII